MSKLTRLAFIGNSLPRRCGIATFTTHLQQAFATSFATVRTSIVAMNDHGSDYDYPDVVRFRVKDDCLDDYIRAADFLNASRVDIVSLQHEFGIFGGEAGSHIMALLSRLTMPIVTTLHTVLAEPTDAQRRVLNRVVDVSATLIVMAEKGRDLLRTVYRVPEEKIEIIPHGIPDVAFIEPEPAKAKLGFEGRPVILTFGLLSPAKGIEVMIDAMPAILQSRPQAVYVILGATHPNLVRDQGEAYRDKLNARVASLQLQHNIVFLDQFVDQATLLEFISMCDVYVTPYLNEAQMTSGTLAYSFGAGTAVVSTPYWHALELLADGRGVLVPFGDAAALGREIAALLTDDTRRQAMRSRAYNSGRAMTWARIAERYLTVFETARRGHRLRVIAGLDERSVTRGGDAPPAMQIAYFLSMCDDTGLLQHAVHSVPDRVHGYCVDDNARALLLACALNVPGEQPLPEGLTARFASFVQHAWNPDTRRFRNFMSFDRRWLEESGSEDSHGRTLWALGECARSDSDASRRRWATALFAEALPAVERFRSPRAWAFTLLGLEAYCIATPGDLTAAGLQQLLAERLVAALAGVGTQDWTWFEDGLTYDNARLPQALLVTGMSLGRETYIAAGLSALRWLMRVQTNPAGAFRPVGTESFAERRTAPQAFDQQPLEAAASISACLAALKADGDMAWRAEATRAFAWFLGRNDLSMSVVDPESGSCRDGLHHDRPNENRGAESVVSYLLGLAEVRQLARMSVRSTGLVPLKAMGV